MWTKSLWGGRPAGRGCALRRCAIVGLLMLAAGCAAPVQRQAEQLHREAEKPPRIVIMPLDVELAEMTAGGIMEPKSEWTEAAIKHMHAALEAEAKRRNVVVVDFAPDRGTPEVRDAMLELVRLHRAVGGAVLVHQYLGPAQALPSKDGKFDWSLGPEVAAIAKAHDADYALFLFVRDSYASAGRVAVIVVGALLGVGVPGGSQVGFSSLVDLKSGNIVAFNRLVRGHGDLRTPEAATETVNALVSDSLK